LDLLNCTVAVTGMNATDNPAPGVAVARALRHEAAFQGRIIGLGYDALDPGFYMEGLLDGAAVLPYPSAGKDALLSRLKTLRETFGIDVLLPTLDSELRAVIGLEAELRDLGIRTFVPSLESVERASKPRLAEHNAYPGVRVPDAEAISTAEPIARLVRRFGLPIMVKGPYYGGDVAHAEADAVLSFHKYVATWGVPIIVQKFVAGEEYNVSAIGDGDGGIVGAVAMRKMALTDKGKGWSGVTVDNPALLDMTRAVMGALRWRGPCEVEILRESSTGELYVVEINPRFPAWIFLSAGAGQNLPYACTRLALGLPVPRPLPPYKVGTLFVRISLDQISNLNTYEQLTSHGVHAPDNR
jgi:carbamoyl-phosphate synthase large subunit